MLYPYPMDLPTGEITQVVIDALRGVIPSVSHGFHCTWHVAGYAAYVTENKSPTAVKGVSRTTPITEAEKEEAAKTLEVLMVKKGASKEDLAIVGAGIPWGVLLPVLLELLRMLRSQNN